MGATNSQAYPLAYHTTKPIKEITRIPCSQNSGHITEDLESKNNFALLSLLRGVNDTKAFIHAKDNFAKDGENPYFLTTWAFALQTQGRHTEAINIVNALKPSDLNDPQRSVYLAKIFFGYGDKDKAKEILSRVDESAMFTEEKNLLASPLQVDRLVS
jgi:hypothetical protein